MGPTTGTAAFSATRSKPHLHDVCLAGTCLLHDGHSQKELVDVPAIVSPRCRYEILDAPNNVVGWATTAASAAGHSSRPMLTTWKARGGQFAGVQGYDFGKGCESR